jgi:hypothetical protein
VTRVGQPGEDVPGRSDQQKGLHCGPWMQAAKAAQTTPNAARDPQMQQDDCNGKDHTDEALGEHVQGAGHGEAAAPQSQMWGVRIAELFRTPEAVERERCP